MADWDTILWSALDGVLVVEGDGLVAGGWLRLAEPWWQGVHRSVEPHPRSCLVDLVGYLKIPDRSTKTHGLRIGVYLLVPNRRLAREWVLVCVRRWAHKGARIPVLPGQMHASRVVYRGVYRTSGNRRLIRQLLSSLLCGFFPVGLRNTLYPLLGAKVNVCQVNRNALSNRG